jgi:hypothetical protein
MPADHRSRFTAKDSVKENEEIKRAINLVINQVTNQARVFITEEAGRTIESTE